MTICQFSQGHKIYQTHSTLILLRIRFLAFLTFAIEYLQKNENWNFPTICNKFGLKFVFTGDFYSPGKTLKSFPKVSREQQQYSSKTKKNIFLIHFSQCFEQKSDLVYDSIHVWSLPNKLNVEIELLLFGLLVFLASVNNSNSRALNS